MNLLRLTARVTGRVQGVGFRRFVQRSAQSLKLTGYARNLPDRTVEVVAEGPKDEIEELMRALIKGPALSRVDDVQSDFTEASGAFGGFDVE